MRQFIRNLRLSQKLLLAPGLLVIILVFSGALSLLALYQQEEAMTSIYAVDYSASIKMDRATQNIAEAQGNIYKMITWGQAAFDQSRIEALGKQQFTRIDSAIALLKGLADSTAAGDLKDKYGIALKQALDYRKTAATVVDLSTVDLNTATMAMVTAEDKFTALSTTLSDAQQMGTQHGEESYAASAKSYSRTVWLFFLLLVAAIITSIFATIRITRLIAGPIQLVNQVLGRVANGNIALTDNAQHIADGDASVVVSVEHEEVRIDRKDEIGLLADSTRKIVASQEQLAASFRRVTETLSALMGETSRLADAAVNGNLSARGNEEKFNGGYRAIIKGVNDTLDAVIGPLNTAAHYVDAISKGNIPPAITETYKGDFDALRTNLNLCIGAVNALVADARMLSEGAVQGKLSIRADVARHQGDFRRVVEGVNATLDALTGPMTVAAVSIDRISKGEIPEKITEEYRGDFNTLKDNLNRCVDGLGGLVESNAVLQRMAVNDFTVQVEGAYPGIYAEVARATNDVRAHLVRLQGTIKEIARGDLNGLGALKATAGGKGRRSESDELVPSFIQMEEAIKRLVDDTRALSAQAVEGKLASRADVEKHQGEFRKVLEGVNETLDAVIKPIEDGGKVLALVAGGDLTARVTAEYQGDHRKIVASINEVAESLDQALLEVWQMVAAAANASSEISASTEEMAAGAQEQTSQAAQVASAVEEMTKTILENSQNASKTADVAKKAKASAESGGEVVSETVKGMRRIAEVVDHSANTVKELGKSSDQIGEIVTVIDDIADQTNLLALNAAIEAARAGDQGRGFAVVADEVRKLAERTTKATKEIAEMIRKIQNDTQGAVLSMEEGTKQVNAGIALTDKAGVSLSEIVGVSQRVTDMVLQIAAASEQQSSASEQISKNVEAISNVTNETAAGTQQIARAANDLNGLTENLRQMIGRFHLSTERESAPQGRQHRDDRGTVAVRANGKLVKR